MFALGWDTLSPSNVDDKYFIHLDGDINFTTEPNLEKLPHRHSYFWTHLTGGYELVDNVWISSWISVDKRSFSESLNFWPFTLQIMPQVSYNNIHHDTNETELADNQSNKLDINIKLGTIGNFTHGKGLFFSQLTGLGSNLYLGLNSTSLEFYFMGSGYWPGDDVMSLYFYPFKKYLGIGVFYELSGLLGDRIVPGINFELIFLKQIKLYGEIGTAYVLNQTYYYPGFDQNPIVFQKNFSINRNTLAGLFGLDWNFSFPNLFQLNGNLANQLRYYGNEPSNYYYPQSTENAFFDYYKDTSIDQKYNNQAHNFYFDPGEKIGLYFRQEMDINPMYNIHFGVRNELVMIYPTGAFSRVYKPHIIELLTLKLFYRIREIVDVGLRLSNVSISSYEVNPVLLSNKYIAYPSEGIFLQPAQSWYVELYSHYKF